MPKEALNNYIYAATTTAIAIITVLKGLRHDCADCRARPTELAKKLHAGSRSAHRAREYRVGPSGPHSRYRPESWSLDPKRPM